jgi:hypothetical protein
MSLLNLYFLFWRKKCDDLMPHAVINESHRAFAYYRLMVTIP